MTFIYPASLRFLSQLVECVNSQSLKDFTLIVFNDTEFEEFEAFYNCRVPFTIVNVSGSLEEIRYSALSYLKEMKSEKIVFMDSDDLMSVNRLEECDKYLGEYRLVVNDLNLMDKVGQLTDKLYWSERLAHETEFDFTFLNDHNIVGFGNTAINSDLLRSGIKECVEVIALDWYIFYQLLFDNRVQAIFINTCQSHYRQHDDNTVGLAVVTPDRLKKAKKAKYLHYSALYKIGFDTRNQLEELEQLDLNDLFPELDLHHFWWEELKIS